MYLSQNDEIQSQRLKVQEVTIRYSDMALYATSGSNTIVLIREPVSAIVSCSHVVDAGPSTSVVAQANLSIVDSVAFTAGGDAGGIKVTNQNLASNDVLVVKYITKN